MGDHWPLAVASGLIALAAAMGLWQHDRAVEVGASTPPPIRPARVAIAPPAAPNAVTPAEKPEAAPAPTQTRTTFQPPVVNPVAPAVAAPVPNPKPAPITTVAQPAVPAIPIPDQPLPIVGAPIPKAVPDPQQTPIGMPDRRTMRTAALNALRADLQAKTNIAAMDIAGGGYALAVDGARLEVKPMPNWNITIYNVNPKAPEAETERFKEVLQATVASLQIDMAPKPVESANGKSYMKTTSKLGSISLIRDPANGNSCVIGPIQQWVAPPATVKNPDQPAVANPVAPAVPAPVEVKRPAPVTKTPSIPPRPPATDANF